MSLLLGLSTGRHWALEEHRESSQWPQEPKVKGLCPMVCVTCVGHH